MLNTLETLLMPSREKKREKLWMKILYDMDHDLWNLPIFPAYHLLVSGENISFISSYYSLSSSLHSRYSFAECTQQNLSCI